MQSGAELLKEWMQLRGYKQARVAEVFGMTVSFVSMLMNRHRVPSLDKAIKIERLTGIPVEAWSSSANDNSERTVAAVGGKRRHSQAVNVNGRK